MKNKRNSRYYNLLLVVFGLFLGWLFFHPSKQTLSSGNAAETATDSGGEHKTVWTCAMHPQIRMDQQGKCPICGMDLIPLSQLHDSVNVDNDAIQMTKEAAALANVMTSVVSKEKPVKEVRLYGKVQADERLLQNQVAQFPGRIEKLNVNFTGETVRKGQVLAVIYSPELVNAQQELLETVKTKQIQPELYEASKEKLKQWKLTDDQIASIEKSGKVLNDFEVRSNTSGTITARQVNTGDYVSQGTVLYQVADLSRVWVLFDAYESDLPFLGKGKPISFTLQAVPGKEFTGNIDFIDPVIDPSTRVAKVRVEASNQQGNLKPEMFATGVVISDLSQYRNDLVIPRSAVLWTGKRSIVYVKQPGTEPVFKMREIELGPSLGDGYVVLNGLAEGEEIVTNGTFSVDASAQLEGKPSMMNPQGGVTNTMPGMDMPGTDMKSGNKPEEKNEMKDMPGMKMPGTTGQNGNTNETSADTSENKVSMDFTMQLNKIYDRYIDLKNALVSSDSVKAGTASEDFIKALSKADMKLLQREHQSQWMSIHGNMKKYASEISSSLNMNEQRIAFACLSTEVYDAVKIFRLMGRTTYYQFCPMFNNGSYWLSETKAIKNPFYGEKMLTCGDTKEVKKFN